MADTRESFIQRALAVGYSAHDASVLWHKVSTGPEIYGRDWFVAQATAPSPGHPGHTLAVALELWHVSTLDPMDQAAYVAHWQGKTETHDPRADDAVCKPASRNPTSAVGWRGVPNNPKNHGVSGPGGRRYLAPDDARAKGAMAQEMKAARVTTRREWCALDKGERRRIRAVARATGNKVRGDLK